MPALFIKVKNRLCTCPKAEDGWLINECSCKTTGHLWIPRNTTYMREKHGHAKIVKSQNLVGHVTEILYLSFLLIKLI